MNSLIDRLVLLYGSPEVERVEAWTQELSRLLARYSATELDRAYDIIARRHRGRYFPAIGVIMGAAEEAREALASPRQPYTEGASRQTPEQQAAWRAAGDWIINTEQGRAALRGRYARPIWQMLRQRFERMGCGESRSFEFDDSIIDYYSSKPKMNGVHLDYLVMFGSEANAARIIERLGMDARVDG